MLPRGTARWARWEPGVVALAVAAAYALFVLWRLHLMGGDPSTFIVAGPPITDPRAAAPNVHVFPPGVTYDGQFFYRLALQPWTDQRTAWGVTLDAPAYRQQRILYPLVAWALSGGAWQLAPAALVVANLAAVSALAYAAAHFARSAGRHVLASLLVTFYPGYVVTVARDLAELTEAALLVACLALLQHKRHGLAAAAICGAALAKETVLVVPVAGLLWSGIARLRRRSDAGPPWLVWAVPLVLYAAWATVVAGRWGAPAFAQGADNFGVPFGGLASFLRSVQPGTNIGRMNLAELCLLACLVVGMVAVFRAPPLRGSSLPIAFALYAGAAALYTLKIWVDDYAFLRALHEMVLTASLALVVASASLARTVTVATVAVWLWFAAQRAASP